MSPSPNLYPIPVHAELVEALSLFFVPGALLHEGEKQPFDKLRVDGFGRMAGNLEASGSHL
jgi:hypothetical protein